MMVRKIVAIRDYDIIYLFILTLLISIVWLHFEPNVN